jgi:hypothetical protein
MRSSTQSKKPEGALVANKDVEEAQKHAVTISIEALKALLIVNAGAAGALIALMDRGRSSSDYSSAVGLFGVGALLTVIAFIIGYYSQLSYAEHCAQEKGAKAAKAFRAHYIWQAAALTLVVVSVAASLAGMADAYIIAKGSAAEAFNIRSRCGELGRKLLADDIHGTAVSVIQTSLYKSKTNRCYVELYSSPADLTKPSRDVRRAIYDGQTGELIAWYTRQEAGQPKETCYSLERQMMGIAENASCGEISSKLTDFMTEDRTQGP